jgi:uncharacterized protein HemY
MVMSIGPTVEITPEAVIGCILSIAFVVAVIWFVRWAVHRTFMRAMRDFEEEQRRHAGPSR